MYKVVGVAVVSLCLCLATLAGNAAAEDTYYHLPISELKITEGALPGQAERNHRWWPLRREYQMTMFPYAVMDGSGEAYVPESNLDWFTNLAAPWRRAYLSIRVLKDKAATGTLFLPKSDFSGMTRVRFAVPAGTKPVPARKFLEAKETHYTRLLRSGAPGGAWFRAQLNEAKMARGEKIEWFGGGNANRNRNLPTDEFDLFTGGRAISENLALDRPLQLNADSGNATVPIETLTGITIREMDWKQLTKGIDPKLDTLAKRVPHDQHALFFPTFDGMLAVMDEANAYGTPILQTVETRTEDAGTGKKYTQQLCLQSSGLSRVFGAQAIASVVLTGSDPYLRSGTDVAVLFECKNMKVLRPYLLTKQAAAKTDNADVKAVSGEIHGVSYVGVRSPDRRICSYLASIDDVLIVTNSPYQLARLVETSKEQTTSLGSLLEFKFFRHRYQLGDEEESAFLMLSDATIRRWCSPRWRIGNSRRTRAMAVLADLQARHQDQLVAGTLKADEFKPPYALDGLGEVWMTQRGPVSSEYGTLEFQTPIAELSLGKVTWHEAQAYRTWRRNYQNLWRRFFDPIGVRLSVDKKRLAADITVMPLSAGTDYSWLTEWTRGGKLTPTSGDPHKEALVNMAFGINNKQGLFWGWPGTPLTSVSLYMEDDPYWAKLGKAENPDEYMEKHGRGMPLAIHVDAEKPDEFHAILMALLKEIPSDAKHETKEHKGHKYHKIVPRAEHVANQDVFAEIYFAKLPQGEIFTFNEAVMRRSLERNFKRAEDAKAGKEPAAVLRPWLGQHAGLKLSREAIKAFGPVFGREYQRLMRIRSWSNVVILNELKRRYPKQDPVEVYEKVWGARLYCPGGGRYTWNADWHTMQSTVYGHPGEPKRGPSLPLGLANLDWADFGVTFENDGLRAKTVMQRRLGD